MIKHILTAKCNRSCIYCITKHLKHEQKFDMPRLRRLYHALSAEDVSIMLTGGEATMADEFPSIVVEAIRHFKYVYLTTQNPIALRERFFQVFDAITFSIHDSKLSNYNVLNDTIVYASILDSLYAPFLPATLKLLGFRGLTVNEDQRSGKPFDKEFPYVGDFSYRVNRRGRCMHDTIILPDLTITHDFTQFLGA